jgi:aminomethyltransferase
MVEATESASDDAAPDPAALKRTPLYETHVALGARMVPFGGWEMPVQYPSGVLAEHHAVRQAAGLFDIGHMGQVRCEGPQALEFLQWVTTNDVTRLDIGAAQYSLLCNDAGGILDDIIVYRLGDTRYLVIVNAANTDADYAWIEGQRKRPGRGVDAAQVELERISPPRTLLAIQGPRSTRILQTLTPLDLNSLGYYHAAETTVAAVEAIVARTGYTGERGYEISFDQAHAVQIWNALLSAGEDAGLIPCGLGARDTLRLEAGMALYGHELSTETNPLEAGLERVVRFDKGEFVGAAALKQAQERGVGRQLVGIELVDRGVLRPEYPILSGGSQVGALTSGGPSPTLKKSRVDAPIVICSASNQTRDRVLGLKLGADDFISKPFDIDELEARIEAVLRRSRAQKTAEAPAAPPAQQQERVGELAIDRGRRRVTLGGETLQLTPTEYRLLCALAAHPDEVLSREELAQQVWGYADASIGRAIDAHISRLRVKLNSGKVPAPPIVSVRGFGYKIVAEASGESAVA